MFSQASLQATRPLKDHPRNTDIKCFVIFLDFHLRTSTATKKLRLSAANQNSRLSSYKNTNLILKTTEWISNKPTYATDINIIKEIGRC